MGKIDDKWFDDDYRYAQWLSEWEEPAFSNLDVYGRIVKIRTITSLKKIDFETAFIFLSQKYSKYGYVTIIDQLIYILEDVDSIAFPLKYYYLAKYVKLKISKSYEINRNISLILKYDCHEFRKYFSEEYINNLFDNALADYNTCLHVYREIYKLKHGVYQNEKSQLVEKLNLLQDKIEEGDLNGACRLYLESNREQQLFFLDTAENTGYKKREIVRNFTESFPNQNYLRFFRQLYEEYKIPEAVEYLFIWSTNAWFGAYDITVYQNAPYCMKEIFKISDNIDWLVLDVYTHRDPDVIELIFDDISRNFGAMILEKAKYPESIEIAKTLIDGEFDSENYYK